VNSRQENGWRRRSRVFVKVAAHNHSALHQTVDEEQLHSHRTGVFVAERAGAAPPVKHSKVPVRDVMKKSRCNAGWRCNRCLHNPVYGTYESCGSVCDDCFIELICSERKISLRKKVTIDVVVRQHRNLLPGEQRIPRVVHQTWLEDLNVDRYPQLARVQSSWKNAGYKYCFYTDIDAREYIAKHFPSCFLDAYDSLVPGAFKVHVLSLYSSPFPLVFYSRCVFVTG
jgi:hypothetical protein